MLIATQPSQQLHVQSWSRSGIFIVNFKLISHLALVFLLLTLSGWIAAGRNLATLDRNMKTGLLFTKNVTFWFRLRIAKTSSWMDSCNGKPFIFRISSDTLTEKWGETTDYIKNKYSYLGQKSSLVTGNPGKKLSLTRPHCRICIRIYIFNFKKQINKQKRKQEYKKSKETKEEKIISLENRLKK